MRVGAIDIGSNSVRLLVADWPLPLGPGTVADTVARAGEVCRLGRGLDRTGAIEPALAERAGDLASDFLRRARALGAIHVVMGATAALRQASNRAEAAAIISRRAGIEVRVLSGDEEAQLVYQSVIAGLGGSVSRSPCVVFDLGGGSTEVVSGIGGQAGRWVSLRFGAVSLTERHLTSDPPAPWARAGVAASRAPRHTAATGAAMRRVAARLERCAGVIDGLPGPAARARDSGTPGRGDWDARSLPCAEPAGPQRAPRARADEASRSR
jgi:exopolyphosphatase/guanosine-5'-triphosphate,3'-diphosphate pyrophosphatase